MYSSSSSSSSTTKYSRIAAAAAAAAAVAVQPATSILECSSGSSSIRKYYSMIPREDRNRRNTLILFSYLSYLYETHEEYSERRLSLGIPACDKRRTKETINEYKIY
jgi:hypothetical protein